MIRNIKHLVLFLIFILLVNCSFHKSKIWSGTEEEKKRIADIKKEQNKTVEVIKIYSSENIYSKEISSSKTVTLSKPQKNISWQSSNLNPQNFTGNIYLPRITNNFLKKRIGKDKFSMSNVKSSPLSINNNIIFSDDMGSIFNINQRGKVNWKKNIYKKIYKKVFKNLSFSIYKNAIYIADNIGFIYALDLDTGKLIWIKNHGIPIKSKLKIFENKIFLIDQDNQLFCLDVKKGTKIWNIRSIPTFIKSQNFLGLAVSKKGDVIALGSSGDLVKAKASNGSIYWSINTTGSMYANVSDFFKSSDVVIADEDIILSTSASTLSININNGYPNWEREITSTNSPIVDGNNIFLVSDNGYFINLDRYTGKTVRSVNLLKILKRKKQKTLITGFILGSGKIYATTLNGYLIVCSAISGKIEYFKKIGDTITSSPIASNGSLYILTEKSRILGFN